MIRYFSVLLVVLCFHTDVLAQNRLERAKENMRQFKNGMLLVRLPTKEASIKALEERGRTEEAQELQEEQREENRETILAFSQVFDFVPVYFFYSQDSKAIQEKDLAGNIFDKDRNEITDTESLPDHYFVGQFGETEKLDIDGFVLMDSTFSPLEPPFPYYSREHVFFGLISRSKGQMIEHLNDRLHSTYREWFPEEEN